MESGHHQQTLTDKIVLPQLWLQSLRPIEPGGYHPKVQMLMSSVQRRRWLDFQGTLQTAAHAFLRDQLGFTTGPVSPDGVIHLVPLLQAPLPPTTRTFPTGLPLNESLLKRKLEGKLQWLGSLFTFLMERHGFFFFYILWFLFYSSLRILKLQMISWSSRFCFALYVPMGSTGRLMVYVGLTPSTLSWLMNRLQPSFTEGASRTSGRRPLTAGFRWSFVWGCVRLYHVRFLSFQNQTSPLQISISQMKHLSTFDDRKNCAMSATLTDIPLV